MRHSYIKLKLGTYSHVALDDLAGAVEALPAIPLRSPSRHVQATEDAVVVPMVVLETGEIACDQGLSPIESTIDGRVEAVDEDGRKLLPLQSVTTKVPAHKKEPPVGLEPTTYALRKRRSAA